MTELICIKKLLESRGASPKHCIGRKTTVCCIECRRKREYEPALEFYRRDLAPGSTYLEEPFPEKEER